MIIIILLIAILLLSLFALLSKDLVGSIIALSAISLLSAGIFLIFKAPDVAITEAAIGAGLTTIIFVWAVRHSSSEDV
ncbi:MAG: DUF4040 domain-containing protein [Spirochaetia bacterium]|nr:DUF4040 domain-containing protein [Spirochaetia bacterium]